MENSKNIRKEKAFSVLDTNESEKEKEKVTKILNTFLEKILSISLSQSPPPSEPSPPPTHVSTIQQPRRQVVLSPQANSAGSGARFYLLIDHQFQQNIQFR